MARKGRTMAEGKPALDKDLIRELAQLLDETGLTEIEIEREGLRVRVGRGAAAAPIAAPSAQCARLPWDCEAARSASSPDPFHCGAGTKA
jgi:acetyl-CoA carboxylase biotin carboxyl carrier protein